MRKLRISKCGNYVSENAVTTYDSYVPINESIKCDIEFYRQANLDLVESENPNI